MAAFEMFDYLTTGLAPDYATTMDIVPQISAVEMGEKNQIVHEGDDGSEEVISLDDQSVFYVSIQFAGLNESDVGTIFDFYNSTAKGNGMARSFKWSNTAEPAASRHTYVVRFASPLPRQIMPGAIYSIGSIKLKVLGVAS